MTIKLGTKVRDTLTGFQGVATARCVYVNGCIQCGIEKVGEDGKIIEHWFDEPRLELVKKAVPATKRPAAKPKRRALHTFGGPSKPPQSRSHPSL